MKTAKQWVKQSNWSDELKELFWERAEESWVQGGYLSLEEAVSDAFSWKDAPEGDYFWFAVAEGKRTDIDRPAPTHAEIVEEVDEAIAKVRDEEYETLVRKLLEGLKGGELVLGTKVEWNSRLFTRGYNTAVREINAKIDEAIKNLEI